MKESQTTAALKPKEVFSQFQASLNRELKSLVQEKENMHSMMKRNPSGLLLKEKPKRTTG